MKRLFLLPLIATISLIGCEKAEVEIQSESTTFKPHNCTSSTCGLDRIYTKNGEKYLWSGQDSADHFVITNWFLEDAQLRDHGLSREAFPALIDPEYAPVSDPAHPTYKTSEKVIVVKGDTEVHAYPYSLMTYHEVVNGEMNGEPYMACYCVLADFAGVYYRKTCGEELTYGVSGYTYINRSLDQEDVEAFILWDRETESLWNPLGHQGVSHTLQGVSMPRYPQQKWEIVTWGQLENKYPDAKVLKSGQTMDAPSSWPQKTCDDFSCCRG